MFTINIKGIQGADELGLYLHTLPREEVQWLWANAQDPVVQQAAMLHMLPWPHWTAPWRPSEEELRAFLHIPPGALAPWDPRPRVWSLAK